MFSSSVRMLLPAYPTRDGRGSHSPGERGAARRQALDRELRDFLASDDRGIIGVVDEVRPDGTFLVAYGWLGRRRVALRLEDVERILFAERELVLRPGLASVAEIRAERGAFARLMARLAGRAPADPRDGRGPRRSR